MVVTNVKTIALDKGMFALVDDEDFDRLQQYTWHARKARSTYYAMTPVLTGGRQENVRMHRLIVGAAQGVEVDHRDGAGLNNQKSNLRQATPSQNRCNRGKTKANTSGYKGVFACGKGWNARITLHGQRYGLGTYPTREQAAAAYDAAASKLHGEFARLNEAA